MTARRRRPRGEGGVFEYRTAAGAVRFGIKFDLPSPDGRRRQVMRRRDGNGQPWLSRDAAVAALRESLVQSGRGEWIDPSKQPTGEYLATWLSGLRLAPSTVASYRKNVRLHITPYIGAVPLASLTPARIAAMYRTLEQSGRADHRQGAGLSARTVRYVATILRAALGEAVAAGMIARNPADPERAKPPTAREARAPEMHPWTAGQLGAFLDWSRDHSQLHAAWHMLAMTGMRRGELLALRWRDIDLDAGTASIRRSAGIVRNAGEGARIEEGPTKTGRPRVIDLDPATVALLRAHRRARGSMALQLARDSALVFGDHEGRHRHPERFSRTFAEALARCAKSLGEDAPPSIRLHDLRHYADGWVMCPAVTFPLAGVAELVLRSA
ncbi:MAG: site-specific integrase [Streptosporangiaceae bacterium]